MVANSISTTERLLRKDTPKGVTMVREFGIDNPLIDSIYQVRREGDEDSFEFAFDRYSYHYCLFVDAEPVGTLTATRGVDGEMDCQQMYPESLLEAHADSVFSPCKFRIKRNRFSSFRLMRLMVREFWRDQLDIGSRLAVMNASLDLIAFYERMGFYVIEGSEFVHPVCGTDSLSLLLSADPSRKSFFTDLFDAIDDPLRIDELQLFCDISGEKINRKTVGELQQA